MLCCLTIDPVVARPTGDGRRPVQLRSLCLFNPAGRTRQSFTIPFQCDPSSHEVALQPPVESKPASQNVPAMPSWRTAIPVPVLVRSQRLGESLPFLGGGRRGSPQEIRFFQHPIHTTGAVGHPIGVQHHISQPTIPLFGVLLGIFDNRLSFPQQQPTSPW